MNKQHENLNPADERQPQESFGSQMFGHIKTGVIATIVLAVIVSGVYPLIVFGLAQVIFPNKANGSLIGKDGKPVSKDADAVGSALLGQSFSDAKYFHPRPSAAGSGYDATASGGSNLGPTSAKLMFGTTKNFGLTVFAADKAENAVASVGGRVQGTVAAVTKTSIAITPKGATTPMTYPLDAAVADPNTVVNYHGRTIHATTIPAGAIVELKLNDKTPTAVVAINVADQEIDAAVSATDTTANKITLGDTSNTVIVVDPKNTVFVVNGKAGAKLDDINSGMSAHIVVSQQMDYDGIADRVIHYCQDNKIDYKSTVPDSAFTDADGVDDQKLVAAFGAATMPSITPDASKPVPADAVTASGSGLDPHISVENARLQAARVADARKMSVDKVIQLISQYVDGPSLGLLGEGGLNVLLLNLALDQIAPVAPAAPATAPTTLPAN